jgi:hypothetical protein
VEKTSEVHLQQIPRGGGYHSGSAARKHNGLLSNCQLIVDGSQRISTYSFITFSGSGENEKPPLVRRGLAFVLNLFRRYFPAQ